MAESLTSSKQNKSRYGDKREDPSGADGIAYGRGETVLLAEKNANLLKLGISLLIQLNYKVIAARNEAQVIEHCLDRPREIDLLILDTSISGMSADNILRKIRACQPRAKAIFYSTLDWQINPDLRRMFGHFPVMSKPFSIRDFSRIIDLTLH